jgi:putative ABC transport system substrate-binding protein
VRRRDLLAALAGTALLPSTLRAQQKAIPVIGLLSFAAPDPSAPLLAAFREGLAEIGYIERRNVTIDYRYAEDHYDRLPALAADLVGRKVDLIATAGGIPAARAAKNATSTIPIVFEIGTDPVAEGLVASLARPGGNLTGVSFIAIELTSKRLELLAELVPQAAAVGLLVNPNNTNAERIVRDGQEGSRTKGVGLHILKAGTDSEIDAAFASLPQLNVSALLLGADPFFSNRRERLVVLAAYHRIPAIYFWREFPAEGGLLSYGPSLPGIYRQSGIYAGKILNGAKPADLPVQQPTKFELVINLKTAKTLGLTVPQSILARADEVIE